MNSEAPLACPHGTHFGKHWSRKTMQNVVFLAQIKLYIAADAYIKCMHRIQGCRVLYPFFFLPEQLTGVSIRGGGYFGRADEKRWLFI